jgi:hypothetical protein
VRAARTPVNGMLKSRNWTHIDLRPSGDFALPTRPNCLPGLEASKKSKAFRVRLIYSI